MHFLKSKYIIVLTILILSLSCSNLETQPVISLDDINIKKTSKSDKKLKFVKVTDRENGHFINVANESFNFLSGKRFDYKKIENEIATFLGKFIKSGNKYWIYKIDSTTFLTSEYDNYWEKNSEYNIANSNYFVFKNTLDSIKDNFLGRHVWLNKTEDFLTPSFRTFIPANDSWFNQYDKVKIIDIDLFYYGGSGNIWFIIKNKNGGKAKLKYDKTYRTKDKEGQDYNYYLYNPLNPKWGNNIIKAIKNNSVKIGMTEYQVIVSWGKPDNINKTISKNNVDQQWVY